MDAAMLIEAIKNFGIPVTGILYYLLVILPQRDKQEAARQAAQDTLVKELIQSMQDSNKAHIEMLSRAIEAQKNELTALGNYVREVLGRMNK